MKRLPLVRAGSARRDCLLHQWTKRVLGSAIGASVLSACLVLGIASPVGATTATFPAGQTCDATTNSGICISKVTADYTASTITLGVAVGRATDPTTDPNWNTIHTALGWSIYENGATTPSFLAFIFLDSTQSPPAFFGAVSEFSSPATTLCPSASDAKPTFSVSANTYGISFSPSCIGSPASFSVHAIWIYTTQTTQSISTVPVSGASPCCTVTPDASSTTTTTTSTVPSTTTSTTTTTPCTTSSPTSTTSTAPGSTTSTAPSTPTTTTTAPSSTRQRSLVQQLQQSLVQTTTTSTTTPSSTTTTTPSSTTTTSVVVSGSTTTTTICPTTSTTTTVPAVAAASASSGTPSSASTTSSPALAFTGNGPFAPLVAWTGVGLLALGALLRRWVLRRRVS
jgi:hypothetical protein